MRHLSPGALHRPSPPDSRATACQDPHRRARRDLVDGAGGAYPRVCRGRRGRGGRSRCAIVGWQTAALPIDSVSTPHLPTPCRRP
jgi:hypothetical protein